MITHLFLLPADAPGQPKIRVDETTGNIFVENPPNMDKRVPFTYEFTVIDLATGKQILHKVCMYTT